MYYLIRVIEMDIFGSSNERRWARRLTRKRIWEWYYLYEKSPSSIKVLEFHTGHLSSIRLKQTRKKET